MLLRTAAFKVFERKIIQTSFDLVQALQTYAVADVSFILNRKSWRATVSDFVRQTRVDWLKLYKQV